MVAERARPRAQPLHSAAEPQPNWWAVRLNAEAAEVCAKGRRGSAFFAGLCANLCGLCVKKSSQDAPRLGDSTIKAAGVDFSDALEVLTLLRPRPGALRGSTFQTDAKIR